MSQPTGPINYGPNYGPPQVPQPQQPQPKQRRKVTLPLLWLILGALAFWLVSCGAGQAIGSSGQPAAMPAPTVTATAPAPPAATVTQSAEPEERTPKSCITALRLADRGFEISADNMGIFGTVMTQVAKAFEAVQSYDVSAMQSATKKINKQRKKLDANSAELKSMAPDYVDAKEDCRSKR